MAKNGIPRHVLTRITEKSARFGSVSQGARVRLSPVWTRIQLRTLKFGVRSQSQAMALSTVGTIQGRSMADRTRRFQRQLLVDDQGQAEARAELQDRSPPSV